MARKDTIKEAYTFDDLLLVPNYSTVLPREVELGTKLTKNITLNIPFISSAMDTVTEHKMAIAMAREGGIGIIHKNLSIARQAAEVRKVKRAESGLITEPVTLFADATVGDAKRIMREEGINGIPILAKGSKKLVGIITNRDLRSEKDNTLSVSKLMTKDVITAQKGVGIIEAQKILEQHRIEKLPVIDKQGNLFALITYRDILQVQNKPSSAKDKKGRLLAGAAVGVTADTLARVKALVAEGVDVICVDTAHGHSQGVLTAVKKIKKEYPTLQIVAGNIATAEAALALIAAGADAVKVGIGPGSICTTRIVTGVGFPQVSAVMDVASVAEKKGIPVIADGGIKQPGDVAKALAAGASTVMIGSMFAGCEESPGETIIYEGRKFKSYRGMGSVEAMAQGSKDRYFQDAEDDIKKLVPEGIVGRVDYKGTVTETLYQLVGSLKASFGYQGSKNIKELWKKARFVKITPAGMTESHPHGVFITKESPNYFSRDKK